MANLQCLLTYAMHLVGHNSNASLNPFGSCAGPSLFADDIAEYFGVKVALYFAWLGHYTCALGVPAVFGTLLWAGLYGRSEVGGLINHSRGN